MLGAFRLPSFKLIYFNNVRKLSKAIFFFVGSSALGKVALILWVKVLPQKVARPLRSESCVIEGNDNDEA